MQATVDNTNNKFVEIVTHERDNRVAILRMINGPVNTLSTDMILSLIDSLQSIERNPQYKILVLTSGLSAPVFCAGLDIREMYKTTRERHHRFWTSLQRLFMNLYMSRLVTIALINGECPAAGCLLSTACDHRLMISAHRIGLNETRLGIVAPWWFTVPYRNLVGHRQAERHLQLGSMLRAKDALALGLVDAVEDTLGQLQEHVDRIVKEWIQVPSEARKHTKHMLRQELVERLRNESEQDWQRTWALVSSDAVQKMLGQYMASLARNKQQTGQERSKL